MKLTVAIDAYVLADANLVGWSWVIDQDNWECGYVEDSVSMAQAQFRALFSYVRRTRGDQEPLLVLTSLEYVASVLQTWRHQWRNNGWAKLDGMPLADLSLIRGIDANLDSREVEAKRINVDEHDLLRQAHIYARETVYSYRDQGAGKPVGGIGEKVTRKDRGKKIEHLTPKLGSSVGINDSLPDNVTEFPRKYQSEQRINDFVNSQSPGPSGVGGLGSAARGAASNLRPITQVVRDEDLRFQKYCSSADRVHIWEMMHPDFISIGELGEPISRTEAAALLAEDPPSPSEIEVRELGPHTAQVIYFDSVLVQSWIWTRHQNSQARLIFQQVTKRPADVFGM